MSWIFVECAAIWVVAIVVFIRKFAKEKWISLSNHRKAGFGLILIASLLNAFLVAHLLVQVAVAIWSIALFLTIAGAALLPGRRD